MRDQQPSGHAADLVRGEHDVVADDWPQRWQEYVGKLEASLAESQRSDALELFTEAIT